MTSKSLVIGLTGGLGSGKSTALTLFKKKGAFVLDADALVHESLKKKKVLQLIKKKFGPDVLTREGTLNRPKMAEIVFSSASKRRTLEKILHPLVRQNMEGALRQTKAKVAVCDVPLLYERGWYKRFKTVVVVTAPLGLRLKRLEKRGLSQAEAKKRIRAQWPLSKKVKRADFVIHNDSTIKKTKNQIDQIWNILLNKA